MRSWFGCAHKNTTFPITLPKSSHVSARGSRTYVVCLECGEEFPYDWKGMKILKSQERHPVEATTSQYETAVPA
jgi:hypothetical protein